MTKYPRTQLRTWTLSSPLSTQTNQSHLIRCCFSSFNKITEINSEAFRYLENTNCARKNSRARIKAFLDTEKAILTLCSFSFKRRPFKCACVNNVFFVFLQNVCFQIVKFAFHTGFFHYTNLRLHYFPNPSLKRKDKTI